MSVDPSRQVIVAPGGAGFEVFGEAIGEFLMNLLDGLLGELIEKIREYLRNPGKIIEDGIELIGNIGGVALAALGSLGGAFFDFIGDIGSTLISLLPGQGPSPKPLPPVYSEIRTNLEAEIQPFIEEFNLAADTAESARADIDDLVIEYDDDMETVSTFIESTNQKITAIGDVDAKIADKAENILGEVETAQTTAEEGVTRSKAINRAITEDPDGDGDLEAAWREQKDLTDEAQNTSIDALARVVRLAFPDINLLPNLFGYPRWAMGAPAWVQLMSTAGYLPPVEDRVENFSYRIRGLGVQSKETLDAIEMPVDVREYRLRGRVLCIDGDLPTIRIVDADDNDLITAWRFTAPENTGGDVENRLSAQWVSGSVAGGVASPEGPGVWQLLDIVVRVQAGADLGWLSIITDSPYLDDVYVHGLRMTVFYALQAEVDFGQQQAINGLQEALDVQSQITDRLTVITDNQKVQMDALLEMQRTQGEMVMRSVVMNLNSGVTQYLDRDGVFFRVYNNDNNIDIQALGTWVGYAIFTLVFGTQHETAMVEFAVPDGQSRRAVRSTQTRTNRKMARLDWWVYAQEQQIKRVRLTNEITAPLYWSELTDLAFPVTTDTSHIIDYSVRWTRTTRGGRVYGIKILRNGSTLKELNQSNIGPNWPWEDGRRTQNITWTGNLTAGDVITFQVRTDSISDYLPTEDQRKLDIRERTISWMEDRTD